MMKKIVRTLIVAALALTATHAGAASVDAAAARMAATRFMQSGHARQFMAGNTVLQLTYTRPSAVDARLADFYIFNTSDGGFVMVAGDDRAEAVLAYGDQAFDPANVPCNLQWLLDLYARQIDYLHAHPDARVERVPAAASSSVVLPLLMSNWSQGAPYNDQCPVIKGKACATGCVATAMAQVMYYWKYPDQLPDLMGYTSNSFELNIPDLPPVTIDWDNMLDTYSLGYAPRHAQAVATLMRYCGQACYMDYGTNGSGAYCSDQVVAMRMFKYYPACRLLDRDKYDAATWSEMMQAELAAHRPILYAGSGPDGGHAFVVDGTDGSKYHINWGWGGTANNYYALDAFDPAGMSFSTGQQMINELYPFEYGVWTEPYDFEADGIYYKKCGDGVMVSNRTPQCGDYSGRVVVPATVTADGQTLNVTGIGNNAFRNCTSLTQVTLPATVKTIGKYAFADCYSLTSVNIPSGVTLIDYGAFENCYRLASLTLPNGLQEIGLYAMAMCSKLQHINVPSSVTTIGDGAFYSCIGLKRVTLGDGVDAVNNLTFAYCDALTDVTIGNGAHTIGEAAFLDCRNLKHITIGNSMDSIGAYAFKGCTALSSLTMWPELPPLTAGENCFEQKAYDNTTVYVIDEMAKEDYSWAEVWINFAHFDIISEQPGLKGDVNGDGEVTVADVNAIIEVILSAGADMNCDVNGDGEVSVADVNLVIDIILAGS